MAAERTPALIQSLLQQTGQANGRDRCKKAQGEEGVVRPSRLPSKYFASRRAVKVLPGLGDRGVELLLEVGAHLIAYWKKLLVESVSNGFRSPDPSSWNL